MDIRELNRSVIDEFRANAGKVGGQMANMPLLLLGTTGARSGQPRTNPLACFEDGDRLLVVASYAGNARHPPWYHNLKANPEVTVEFGAETFRARASELPEPARTDAWQRIAAALPVFAEYQSRTERRIPVIALERID